MRGSRLPSKHGCWLWMAVCAGCVHRLRNLSLPALQQSIRSAAAAAATLPRRPASAAARRVWKAGLLRAEQRQGRAGTMGLVADLTAGEVLEQLVFALRVAPVRNVVFMVPPPARRPPGARPASGDRRCRQQGRRVAAQLSGPWCTCSEADTVGSTACPPATSRPGRSRSPAYARAGHGRAAEQLGAREGCGARDGRPQPLRPQAQQGAPPRARPPRACRAAARALKLRRPRRVPRKQPTAQLRKRRLICAAPVFARGRCRAEQGGVRPGRAGDGVHGGRGAAHPRARGGAAGREPGAVAARAQPGAARAHRAQRARVPARAPHGGCRRVPGRQRAARALLLERELGSGRSPAGRASIPSDRPVLTAHGCCVGSAASVPALLLSRNAAARAWQTFAACPAGHGPALMSRPLTLTRPAGRSSWSM